MRAIDGDALYEKVTKEIGFPEWNIIPHAIEDAPTLDVVPVVHGRWVEVAGGRTICNHCGEYPLYDYFGRQKFSNCCPNCGIKMDGEHDGV